jgi:hypothetical protein
MTERTMPKEGFLRRWARRKSEVRDGGEAAPEALVAPAGSVIANADAAIVAPTAPAAPAAPQIDPSAARPLPTLEDVAALGADSDFSAFVARGVDQAVRRSALKKLFADPHFNAMDRLDVYIDDYTKPSPVSEAMLASLEHAKSALMKMAEPELQPDLQAELKA